MVALKRYIEKKFNKPSIWIDELDEWLVIDINNEGNIFDCPSISFNLLDKFLHADIPVENEKVEKACNILDNYGFNIIESHDHHNCQHIHIEGKFDKKKIDLLAEILQ